MGPWKGKKIDREALEARRLEAAVRFSEGIAQGEVARRLHVQTSSVSRWYRAWQAGGTQALRQKAPGAEPRLREGQLAEVEAALLAGPRAQGYGSEVWTLERIARLIEARFGVRFSVGYVWKLLHKLHWSPQRPALRAKERDDAAIEHWRWRRRPSPRRGTGCGCC